MSTTVCFLSSSIKTCNVPTQYVASPPCPATIPSFGNTCCEVSIAKQQKHKLPKPSTLVACAAADSECCQAPCRNEEAVVLAQERLHYCIEVQPDQGNGKQTIVASRHVWHHCQKHKASYPCDKQQNSQCIQHLNWRHQGGDHGRRIIPIPELGRSSCHHVGSCKGRISKGNVAHLPCPNCAEQDSKQKQRCWCLSRGVVGKVTLPKVPPLVNEAMDDRRVLILHMVHNILLFIIPDC
mmetsp:Transcript_73103/g.136644  ORF Transcript_73103/g.136644 Transcript_73103/m.136644 type:complete len:238 (-) Transcript_73103:234-947(-)